MGFTDAEVLTSEGRNAPSLIFVNLYNPYFFPGATLSGGARMGFIGRKSLSCLITNGAVCGSSENS